MLEGRLRLLYAAAAGVVVSAFTVAGVVLATAFPYSQWDSFAFGDWSRRIAVHGSVDPYAAGSFGAIRPVFYELQGMLWRVTGTSFTAGRLLSLVFALLLLAAVWCLVRDATADLVAASVAVIGIVGIPAFTAEALAGQSDVPAAALVALTAAVALRPASLSRTWFGALVVCALIAALTKPTVFVPLVALAIYLAVTSRRRSAAALTVGLAGGLLYDLVMAWRFHEDLVTFLRSGTGETIFGLRAAHERWHAVLDIGFLGPALRLPLACGLVYAIIAVCGRGHRQSALGALALGGVWTILGPIAAGGTGSFSTVEAGFATIGFAGIWMAAVAASPEDAPARSTLWTALVLVVPPVLVWIYGTAFADRLVSAAWPGAMLLIGATLATGIHRAARAGWAFGLVPATLLLASAWIGLASFDGLHGYDWVEVRQLGWSGLRDRAQTMNIVLPQIQSTLAEVEPILGNGRLATSDPRFSWFLKPTDTFVPLRCVDVAHDRVLVLSTSDESEYEARGAGGLATPAQWAACKRPRLTLVAAGDDGYAVFRISPA